MRTNVKLDVGKMRAAMARCGMSDDDLRKAAHINRYTLYRIRSGGVIGIDMSIKIAAALGVKVEDLEAQYAD